MLSNIFRHLRARKTFTPRPSPRQTAHLHIEPLEERALLSGTGLSAGAAVIAPPPSIGHSGAIINSSLLSDSASYIGQKLTGHGHGHYTSQPLMVDAGITYHLQGTANISMLGRTTVTGAVYGLGDIASGQASGHLTFTDAKGSVTVVLQGPVQKGFSPLPTMWSYRVTGATGAFRGLKDQGELQLIFVAGRPTPSANGVIPIAAGGTFTLTLPRTLPPQYVSGIDGTTTIGPISPVDHVGVPNSKPLAGAVISIQTLSGQELARVTSDQNGHFHINLAAGTYRLVPVSAGAGRLHFPLATPQVVVVSANKVADVTFEYNSGIV
jgi:hypothetical protein